MVLAFILIGFTALIPIYSSKINKSKRILSILNALGAGIFFSTAIMHILPESVELYEMSLAKKAGEDPHAGHGHRLLVNIYNHNYYKLKNKI
jgi:hypothetical protein